MPRGGPKGGEKGQPDAHAKLARLLAHNDKRIRDNTVKKIRRWISKRGEVSHLDLLKIWKGLFYCFWMSDKRPVQAELAQKISRLIDRLTPERASAYLHATWETLLREWGGIDHLRMDKFMLLQREILYQTFLYLRTHGWDPTIVRQITKTMAATVLEVDNKTKRGLCLHTSEIYLDELSRVLGDGDSKSQNEGSLGFDGLIQLLAPFFDFLRFGKEQSYLVLMEEEIFNRLVEAATLGSKEDPLAVCLSDISGEKRASKFSALLLCLAADPDTLEDNRDRIYSMRDNLLKHLDYASEPSLDTIEPPESFRSTEKKDPPIKLAKKTSKKKKRKRVVETDQKDQTKKKTKPKKKTKMKASSKKPGNNSTPKNRKVGKQSGKGKKATKGAPGKVNSSGTTKKSPRRPRAADFF